MLISQNQFFLHYFQFFSFRFLLKTFDIHVSIYIQKLWDYCFHSAPFPIFLISSSSSLSCACWWSVYVKSEWVIIKTDCMYQELRIELPCEAPRPPCHLMDSIQSVVRIFICRSECATSIKARSPWHSSGRWCSTRGELGITLICSGGKEVWATSCQGLTLGSWYIRSVMIFICH